MRPQHPFPHRIPRREFGQSPQKIVFQLRTVLQRAVAASTGFSHPLARRVVGVFQFPQTPPHGLRIDAE
jgi:hypothetical protein